VKEVKGVKEIGPFNGLSRVGRAFLRAFPGLGIALKGLGFRDLGFR